MRYIYYILQPCLRLLPYLLASCVKEPVEPTPSTSSMGMQQNSIQSEHNRNIKLNGHTEAHISTDYRAIARTTTNDPVIIIIKETEGNRHRSAALKEPKFTYFNNFMHKTNKEIEGNKHRSAALEQPKYTYFKKSMHKTNRATEGNRHRSTALKQLKYTYFKKSMHKANKEIQTDYIDLDENSCIVKFDQKNRAYAEGTPSLNELINSSYLNNIIIEEKIAIDIQKHERAVIEEKITFDIEAYQCIVENHIGHMEKLGKIWIDSGSKKPIKDLLYLYTMELNAHHLFDPIRYSQIADVSPGNSIETIKEKELEKVCLIDLERKVDAFLKTLDKLLEALEALIAEEKKLNSTVIDYLKDSTRSIPQLESLYSIEEIIKQTNIDLSLLVNQSFIQCVLPKLDSNATYTIEKNLHVIADYITENITLLHNYNMYIITEMCNPAKYKKIIKNRFKYLALLSHVDNAKKQAIDALKRLHH